MTKSTLPINMPYVSLNNFTSDLQIKLYRAKDSGVGIENDAQKVFNLEMEEDSSYYREFANIVPSFRTCLIVEGLAGKGLRDCAEPKDVCDILEKEPELVARRYIETYYNPKSTAFKGYSIYAADSIELNVSGKTFVRMGGKLSEDDTVDDKSTLPNPGYIRCDGKMCFNKSASGDGVVNAFGGTLYHHNEAKFIPDDNSWYTFKDSSGNEISKQFKTLSQSTKDMNKVDEVDKKDIVHAKKCDSNKILPGLYEWHKVTSSAESGAETKTYYELRYYEEKSVDTSGEKPKPKANAAYWIAVAGSLSEGQSDTKYKVVAPEGKLTFVADSEGNITEPTLSLNGNLYCDGDLMISVDMTDVSGICPQIYVNDYVPYKDGEPVESKKESGLLTAKDDITFIASVKGQGALVTDGGDVSFIGESVIDSSSEGVAIYAKNVNLRSLEYATDKISDHALTNANTDGYGGWVWDNNRYFGLDAGDMWKIVDKHVDVSNPYSFVEPGESTDSGVKQDITDYVKKNFGVNCSCVSTIISKEKGLWGTELRKFKFEIPLYQGNGDGCTAGPSPDLPTYEVAIYCDCWGNKWTNINYKKNNSKSIPVFWIQAPQKTWLYEQSGEAFADLLSLFSSVKYGDQRIKGVIYAKDNFNVDLKGQFKVILEGAIYAKKITGNCQGIDINYDESCVQKLMPSYNKLTCELWNCW